MSAETLREAADLMRERAGAATPGPWLHQDAPNGFPSMVVGNGMVVADTYDKPHLSDARHIAGMDPLVALEVADWLDGCAHRAERTTSARLDMEGSDWFRPALAVACRYLGERP